MSYILLVEDDLYTRELIKIIVNEFYPCFSIAGSTELLYMIYRKGNPRIAILDYMLGCETCEPIIKDIRLASPKTKLLLCSAFSGIEDHAKLLNIEDFIKKPFDIDHLNDKLKTMLHE